MKRHVIAIIICLATTGIDLLTKNWIIDYLIARDPVDYLNGFLRITLVYNRGGVFGILQGYKNIFLIISILVLVVMIAFYVYERDQSLLFSISMSMIAGGALGNIIDRLIPGRPGVVDFISIGIDGLYRWPAFNFADSMIVVGAAILMIIFYKEEKKNRRSGSTN